MDVSLREITSQTVRQIIGLTVADDQQHLVASNAVSLAQALFQPEAWYRAIYQGDEPVGFVMLYDESLRPEPPAEPEAFLWRFMIDARQQGRGVGARALQEVIDHVAAKGVFRRLRVSFVREEGNPEGFYLRAGFVHTGEVDDGEVVLELPLQRAPA
jgi:diamine N-acetyltransferase